MKVNHILTEQNLTLSHNTLEQVKEGDIWDVPFYHSLISVKLIWYVEVSKGQNKRQDRNNSLREWKSLRYLLLKESFMYFKALFSQ